MNRQPFTTPPRAWESKMTPWFARAWFPFLQREMRQKANIQHVELRGLEHLQGALKAGAGVLITPNHSFHYDSYVLGHAAHQIARPFHVLAAWQVFHEATPFQRLVMQWSGIFSIDREGTDVGAFKRAVEILRTHHCPLVIFPEGDIYHTNDRVMPFREGAAAIALSAAKRAERPLVVIPTALKCRYVTDPTSGLLNLMSQLEQTLNWRPQTQMPLPERIYRFAEGLLALKELEYLGQLQAGTIPARTAMLIQHILEVQEQRYHVMKRNPSVPERVKELRRQIIERLAKVDSPLSTTSPNMTATTVPPYVAAKAATDTSDGGQLPSHAAESDSKNSVAGRSIAAPLVPERVQLERDMEDLFFVIQLYSYPGDYVAEKPSIERIAETLDKFEEDALRVAYPHPRGVRHATVSFGEPIPLGNDRSTTPSAAQLTCELERHVQLLLDQL